MQEIEPFYNWEKYYSSKDDAVSPFFRRDYNLYQYENDIYGYYIHPLWDSFGSETLYLKVLFADYPRGYVVLEMFGEWNDALHNDIMHLKRNVLDYMLARGLNKFILVGENILNYHGHEDDYYAEWFEDVEDGWIAAINFRDFVQREWEKYNLDHYINFGGTLDVPHWRTLRPQMLCELVERLIVRRLG